MILVQLHFTKYVKTKRRSRALKTLAKELKKKCGVGGALKDGVVEIQGDQRDLLVSELSKRGFTVKKAGG